MTAEPAPMPQLDLLSLRAAFASGALTPTALVEALIATADPAREVGIWIERVAPEALRAAARALEARRQAGEPLPLYGVPFAVKDNIDVAGLATTAACPAYAYRPEASAPAVARLLAAGALVIGKTNLDQFATGLVGVRSPYGVPTNPFDPRYITGGSSSGSAAAVSRGLVSFALGTDTAGSGRVPAAFTNLVGWKPSPGLISTRGVVPACRSLDCVSVFALTVEDARAVAASMVGYDAADPFSRPAADDVSWATSAPSRFRCGIPAAGQREFFGDVRAAAAFDVAIERLQAMGGEIEEIDLAPFLETASLLYDGPWIAERLAGLQSFVDRHPEALLPVTLEILREGQGYPGTGVFAGQHRLAALRQIVRPIFQRLDTLVMPTAPTIYTIAEVAAEPRAANARLGRYVNFVNLLDLAGVAVPSGFRDDGLPTGITFLGRWGSDPRLGDLASRYHQRVGGTVGATKTTLPPAAPSIEAGAPEVIAVAVVGAHLSGEPLNHQLVDRGATLVRACRTAPVYRLYALPGTTPPKPGLVRVTEGGVPLEVEVWALPRAALGTFFAGVVAPLALGTLLLEDGEKVAGFICEGYAREGAEDISGFGGWRGYLRSRQ